MPGPSTKSLSPLRTCWPSVVAGAVSLLAAAVLLHGWLVREPPPDIVASVPGMDDPQGHRRRDLEERARRTIGFGSIHAAFDGTPAAIAGSWPRFRGQHLDNRSHEDIALADSFPESGPPKLWSLELGSGYAGAAVHGGRVFILDYVSAEEQSGDVLRCFSLADGKEIWRCGYPIYIASNHGITRTVPAVTERYTVTLGPMGHVMCADTDSGRVRWGLDLMRDYGTRELSKCWYAGQCPLIENDQAIIAPAGSNVLMMAVSCETGDVLWTAPNSNGWKMSHSSITPMTVNGVKTYVYAAIGGVAAVAAEGERAGRVLWQTEEWSSSVVMPSPVVLDDNRLFLTSGYGGGSALLEVQEQDGVFGVAFQYNNKGRRYSRNGFSCYQQTPIYYRGHLFGIQSNDARKHRMEFVCVEPVAESGGRFVWASGEETVFTSSKKREAWGPYVLADGKFYVFGDTGLMALFEAATDACRKLGEWQIMEGHEVWGPVAVAGGRLLVRDVGHMVCYDIRAGD